MPERQPEERVQIPRMLGRFWTFANMLSMARMVLVLPITYLIWKDGPLTWIFALVLVGVLTDWLDGRVARWSQTVSEWGKVLDPLADKFASVLIVAALVARPGSYESYSLPLWLFMLIVLRDTLIVGGGIILARRTGRVVMSVWMGKVAVTGVAVTVFAALLRADADVLRACVWTTAVLLVASFVQYCFRYARLIRAGRVSAGPENTLDPVRESMG